MQKQIIICESPTNHDFLRELSTIIVLSFSYIFLKDFIARNKTIHKPFECSIVAKPPDNLVMLCKFKSSLFISLEVDPLYVL